MLPIVESDAPRMHKMFKGENVYRVRCGDIYSLLPFKFISLDDERYLVSNLVGEYVVLRRPQLQSFIGHQLNCSEPLYDELKSKHFLFDSDSNVALELLAIKYRTKLSELSLLTGLFMFVVTLRCEHSCPYCQVSRQSQDRKSFDMTRDHADRAIDIVFQSPNPSIKIEFQGGEPLLNFDLVKHVVETAKRKNREFNKDLSFVIATNLALLSDEILEFCKQHDVYISTSLDGPKDLHNRNRPRPGGNSYELTIEGIKRAKQWLGDDHVAALMTTTEASLSCASEIVDEYVDQGLCSIFLRPLSPFGFAVKTRTFDAYNAKQWFGFYTEGLDRIIEHNLKGRFLREEFASIILQKMNTPFPSTYVDLQSPAGIGISALAFNYDGNIFASDEGRMLHAMGDSEFVLGHLDRDDLRSLLCNDRLADWLSVSMTESAPQCVDCAIQPYCGSDPVFHKATQGDLLGHKPTSSFCYRTMNVVKHLVRMLEDRPEVQPVFESWLR